MAEKNKKYFGKRNNTNKMLEEPSDVQLQELRDSINVSIQEASESSQNGQNPFLFPNLQRGSLDQMMVRSISNLYSVFLQAEGLGLGWEARVAPSFGLNI